MAAPPNSRCGICILCCCLQLVTPVRDETASIPDACLPAYSGMSPQLFPQHIVHFDCALRGCDHVQIIKEGNESLRLNNMGMRGSLSLQNVVDASEIILPQESRRPSEEHSDEGQDAIAAVHAHQPLQHCVAGDQIECSNSVH